ncbi:hypothetical protein VTK56DRAFT_5429 [Thermocarpiscus australiensis]
MLSNLLPFPMSKLTIGLAILPVAIPVAYLFYLDRVVSKEFKVETGLRGRKQRTSTTQPVPRRPVTLPQDVETDDSTWVLAHERVVSQPLYLSSLAPDRQSDLSGTLTSYVRGTMAAFSWTPQAFVLRAWVKDSGVRKTFDTQFIQKLDFQEGDRVNGFWRVAYRGDGGLPGAERVEMALDAPPTYSGPRARGVVVAGFERQDDGSLAFINETWMWRKQSEPPVLLERRIAQRLHVLLAGWLVTKGIKAATDERGKSV